MVPGAGIARFTRNGRLTETAVSRLLGSEHFGEEVALCGGAAGAPTTRAPEDEGHADGDDRARERAREVHPVAGEVGADQVGAERAGGVHRRARDGTSPEAGQRDV